MQMVANGYGMTLLPRVAVDVELRDERVKLLRFAEPAARPHRGARLAAHLAAQGGFRRAGPAHHRNARRQRTANRVRGSQLRAGTAKFAGSSPRCHRSHIVM